MQKTRIRYPILSILLIFLLCYVFRVIEYMFIRTDQSFWGEALLHKLAGILILALVVHFFALRWSETGFATRSALRYVLYGLLLGAAVYLLAYGVEYFIQLSAHNNPSVQLYVTSYAINGNKGNQTAFVFFLICVVGNIINVTMEEGVFRGLFVRLALSKFTFGAAVAISSVLFGLWHVIAPIRNYLDGEMSGMGAAMYALMLIGTTAITGVKFCLLTRITGSVWLSMADHFFNNTIVNLLHVVTLSGADEFQTIRITIAQTLSFLIVLFIYLRTKAYRKPVFRAQYS